MELLLIIPVFILIFSITGELVSYAMHCDLRDIKISFDQFLNDYSKVPNRFDCEKDYVWYSVHAENTHTYYDDCDGPDKIFVGFSYIDFVRYKRWYKSSRRKTKQDLVMKKHATYRADIDGE